jgi:penicillin V acylase-like amidase (Ntn superfamily)
MIRYTDIRTTMSVYGDVVTDEMNKAGLRIAELTFQTSRAQSKLRC